MSRILPQSFYERESLEVAVDLLGKLLRHGPVTLRITEVEAYRFPGDTANHCRFGRTARNAPMWGPAGHAYVYLCYGLHQLLNLVTDGDDRGAAVLIRACEPIAGLDEIRARRGHKQGPVLLTGPGKVGTALGVDTRFSGHALFERGGLEVLDAEPVSSLLVGPRVGVDYAEPVHRAAPWRLAVAGTPWVSQRATLAPLAGSVADYLARERMDAQHTETQPAQPSPTRVAKTKRVRTTSGTRRTAEAERARPTDPERARPTKAARALAAQPNDAAPAKARGKRATTRA